MPSPTSDATPSPDVTDGSQTPQTTPPRPARGHAVDPGRDSAGAPVHRAPRVLPFVVIGTLLGVVAAGLVTALGPESAMYSAGRSFGFFAVMFGIAGLLLGGLAFALVDALAQRRTERRTR